MIGEGRGLWITSFTANGLVKPVNGEEFQRICTDITAHRLKAVILVRKQLIAVRRIDSVEVRMEDHRACDADMHFLGTRIPDHLHDLDRGCAAHDGIIHQNDTLAFNHRSIGRMLELHTQRTNLLRWLNKGTADIVVADDAIFKRNTAGLRKTKRRWRAAIWHGNNNIGFDWRFLCQFHAHVLARNINTAATNDRVRPGEIDILKQAETFRLWIFRLDTIRRNRAIFLDFADDDLAIFHIADIFRADNIESTGFRTEDRLAVKLTHNEWSDTDRVTRRNQLRAGQGQHGITALNLTDRINKAITRRRLTRTRNHVQNNFSVRCGLKDCARCNQLLAKRNTIGEITVMRNRDAANFQLCKKRLHIAQDGFACRGIAHMADSAVAGQTMKRRRIGEVIADQPQSVQTKRCQRCRIFMAENTKYTTLFMQRIIVQHKGVFVMRLLGHRPQGLSIAVTKSNIYSKSPRFKSDPLHDARFSR